MSDDLISAEQAQVLLGEMEAVEIRELWQVPWDFSMALARTVIAQAAEITRLRAQVRAADGVAESGAPVRDFYSWTESADDDEIVIMRVGTCRKLRAALATYQQAKEGGE